jgi:hypothetical protein
VSESPVRLPLKFLAAEPAVDSFGDCLSSRLILASPRDLLPGLLMLPPCAPRHTPGFTRCPLVHTGRAWAASGSMCEVIGCAIPIGSNEPLYGRTDIKSPMVYSSMVHAADGEGGSIHDDEMPGPGCRGGAAPSSAEAVRAKG